MIQSEKATSVKKSVSTLFTLLAAILNFHTNAAIGQRIPGLRAPWVLGKRRSGPTIIS